MQRSLRACNSIPLLLAKTTRLTSVSLFPLLCIFHWPIRSRTRRAVKLAAHAIRFSILQSFLPLSAANPVFLSAPAAMTMVLCSPPGVRPTCARTTVQYSDHRYRRSLPISGSGHQTCTVRCDTGSTRICCDARREPLNLVCTPNLLSPARVCKIRGKCATCAAVLVSCPACRVHDARTNSPLTVRLGDLLSRHYFAIFTRKMTKIPYYPLWFSKGSNPLAASKQFESGICR